MYDHDVRLVTTYREAYRERRWTLCDDCDHIFAEARRSAAGIGPLGPVEHGAHEGLCDLCDATDE